MDKMNDKFEKDLFRSCTDFFMCLSKGTEDEMENFGMWAMYGNLNTKVEHPSAKDASQIGVKICFPKETLNLMRSENKNLTLHSVAYAKIIENYENPANVKAYVGSSSGIPLEDFDKEKLSGFVKDTAGKYENEMRFRIKRTNERMTDERKSVEFSEEVFSQLKIYPSPIYSAEECERIFDELRAGKKVPKANFRENIYKGSVNLK